MRYIQLIVQTEPPHDQNPWRATAHRTDVMRHEYRGLGSSELAAAEDAVGQLLRAHTRRA